MQGEKVSKYFTIQLHNHLCKIKSMGCSHPWQVHLGRLFTCLRPIIGLEDNSLILSPFFHLKVEEGKPSHLKLAREDQLSGVDDGASRGACMQGIFICANKEMAKFKKNKKRSNIKWTNLKKGKYKYQRGSGEAAWAGVNGPVALGSGWIIQ